MLVIKGEVIMFIKSVDYVQWENSSRSWSVEGCTLDNINLIVGKNATGKTKTLNVIGNLARLLAGESRPFGSGNYKLVKFEEDGIKISLSVVCEDGGVKGEKLSINGVNRLNRRKDNSGKIWYEREGKFIDFQAPANEIVSFARRDSIQHPFLDRLYDWGKSLRHYYFGKTLGQDHLAVFTKSNDGERKEDINLKDTGNVVAILRKGNEDFPGRFYESIIRDMGEIGYGLDEIGVKVQSEISVDGPVRPGELSGVYVKETDLNDITEQMPMSQGMFRALSLVTQITYSEFTKKPLCIIIDDIGEGLDYDRASSLIKLLIRRAKNASVQLIMSTNDRFVMNNVPLEYWSIIERIGGVSKIHNYRNSRKMFEEFELTGLNNYDLFSSGFFLKEFGEK